MSRIPTHLKKLKPSERKIQKALGTLPHPTFEDMYKDETGTIYNRGEFVGIKYIVMRGPGSMCCYIGIPRRKYNKFTLDYDGIPISVHGGLTYSDIGLLSVRNDKNIHWLGWDYSHAGDMSFYDLNPSFIKKMNTMKKPSRKKWTPYNGLKDCHDACIQMKKLIDED